MYSLLEIQFNATGHDCIAVTIGDDGTDDDDDDDFQCQDQKSPFKWSQEPTPMPLGRGFSMLV